VDNQQEGHNNEEQDRAYVPNRSLSRLLTGDRLIRYKLSKQKHTFNAVFYLEPLDDKVGVLNWLYPVPPDFLFNFRPEEHEDAYTINLDYRNWQVVRGTEAPPDASK
jgi:hypothetical protein